MGNCVRRETGIDIDETTDEPIDLEDLMIKIVCLH